MTQRMPHLAVYRHGRRLADVALAPPGLDIGRDPDAAIHLDDRLVSRRHARVFPAEGAWILEDLEAPNGTFVNGVREFRRPLKDGDLVELGPFVLVFRIDPHERVPDLPAPAPATRATKGGAGSAWSPARDERDPESTTGTDARTLARVREEARQSMRPRLVEQGPVPRVHALRKDRQKVGASEACAVRVQATGRDEAAEVERRADGAWVVRKRGFFSTMRVNGAKVREAVLSSGDRIELGDAEFVFEAGAGG